MVALPTTELEIAAFVEAFEACTLPKERWTHGAHVLTGAWYVHALGEAAATDRMRVCVSRYNEAMGGKNTATSGYHETITVFWIKVLSVLCAAAGEVGRAEFARAAEARFGQERKLHQRFYDFDVVGSEEARRVWVAPMRTIHAANL